MFGHERPRSLQLLGTVGTGKVHILIDNGSTHNFVHPGVVERMKLPVKNTKLFKVYIGNVETLLCKNLCAQVTLETYCVKTYLFLERLNAKYIKNKKMKAEFQRRLWDPGINISSKQHLEGKGCNFVLHLACSAIKNGGEKVGNDHAKANLRKLEANVSNGADYNVWLPVALESKLKRPFFRL
ncbi:hypothetical protein Tco_0506035 [Tanacetum coccineum]